MEKLPNLVRNRLQASRSAKHPDPNLLNAFADQSLAGPERSFVLEHLARCSDCRQILALAAPELQPVAARPFRFDLVRAGQRKLPHDRKIHSPESRPVVTVANGRAVGTQRRKRER